MQFAWPIYPATLKRPTGIEATAAGSTLSVQKALSSMLLKMRQIPRRDIGGCMVRKTTVSTYWPKLSYIMILMTGNHHVKVQGPKHVKITTSGSYICNNISQDNFGFMFQPIDAEV